MQVVCEATQCPDTRVSNVSNVRTVFVSSHIHTPTLLMSVFSLRCVWRPYRTW